MIIDGHRHTLQLEDGGQFLLVRGDYVCARTGDSTPHYVSMEPVADLSEPFVFGYSYVKRDELDWRTYRSRIGVSQS